MKVKFKKLNKNAIIPFYANVGDAGLDLVATSIEFNDITSNIIYGTGISVEIPENYVGLLFPRSSIYKTILSLTNSVGVIDSSYRGEIKLIFIDNFAPNEEPQERFNEFKEDFYQIGNKIGQLIIMPYPIIQPIEVNELSTTTRSNKGFGSTGK